MRETDIRPQALLDEYLRLSSQDTAIFFPDAHAFGPRPCPACAHDRPHSPFLKDGVSYVRCGQCQTLYAAPCPLPERLNEFYRDSASQRFWADTFFPAVAEARRTLIFRPRVDRIRALLADAQARTDLVLDVGAGTGIFLEECRAGHLGKRLVAVEPADRLAQICRDKGLETYQGFAADAGADPTWTGQADLVVSFEVVEHVHAPVDFVADLARLVRPGGHVLFTGLCGTGFDIMTLGPLSKAVAPPHHLNFLSLAGVTHLLERTGLEPVTITTPGQLDVDLVAQALAGNDQAVADPFLRHLLRHGDDEQRAGFQRFLAENRLSSHMWVLARRPHSSTAGA